MIRRHSGPRARRHDVSGNRSPSPFLKHPCFQEWCCHHEKRGCDSVLGGSFDCDEGFENWQRPEPESSKRALCACARAFLALSKGGGLHRSRSGCEAAESLLRCASVADVTAWIQEVN